MVLNPGVMLVLKLEMADGRSPIFAHGSGPGQKSNQWLWLARSWNASASTFVIIKKSSKRILLRTVVLQVWSLQENTSRIWSFTKLMSVEWLGYSIRAIHKAFRWMHDVQVSGTSSPEKLASVLVIRVSPTFLHVSQLCFFSLEDMFSFFNYSMFCFQNIPNPGTLTANWMIGIRPLEPF